MNTLLLVYRAVTTAVIQVLFSVVRSSALCRDLWGWASARAFCLRHCHALSKRDLRGHLPSSRDFGRSTAFALRLIAPTLLAVAYCFSGDAKAAFPATEQPIPDGVCTVLPCYEYRYENSKPWRRTKLAACIDSYGPPNNGGNQIIGDWCYSVQPPGVFALRTGALQTRARSADSYTPTYSCPANSSLINGNQCQCTGGYEQQGNTCVPPPPPPPCGANMTRVEGVCVCSSSGFTLSSLGTSCVAKTSSVVPNSRPATGLSGTTCERYFGNPIDAASGAKTQEEEDLRTSGAYPLLFSRFYSSYDALQVPDLLDDTQLGAVWRHNFSHRLGLDITNGKAVVALPDGSLTRFSNSAGTWSPSSGADSLVQSGSTWTFRDHRDDSKLVFDATGRLQKMVSRSGVETTLTYTSGRLTQVSNPVSKTLTLSYDSNGRISRAEISGGQFVQYAYDTTGRLATVTHADNTSRGYQYTSALSPRLLTAIVDERGNVYNSFSYDASGLATSTQLAGGVSRYQFSYSGLGNAAGHSTTITDPLNTSRSIQYGPGLVKAHSLPSADSTADVAARAFDALGLTLSETDFLGAITTYTWDSTRRLPQTRVEASNQPEARTTTTQWHPTFRLPILETEAGRTTAWTYDTAGRPLTQTVTDTATSQARTWAWTYTALGLMASSTEPNGAVTTNTYDAAGNLTKVSNALGHETTFGHDTAGRVTSKTEPNGLVSSYVYDARGRVTSITRGTEVTGYSWDGAGLLTGATLPGGATLAYTYDAAQRLTQVQDGLGNKLVYTLDNMGNVTKEEAFDPSNALARTKSWAYNNLNRLASEVGGATPATQVTQQTFDLNANPTGTSAPLSRNTSRTFDSLNRLKQINDPASGVTKFEYDVRDNLTKVTDPKNLDTTYSYNAFGDLLTQVSPDTGTTTFTYNAAGQLLTRTDARGVTATYTWDVLSRVATITYPDETVTFTYDSCTNGKGQLCSLVDKTGTTSYTYTLTGRIASKTQVVGAVTQTLSYTYNAAGQLTQMTTPSGKTIGYTWANGRVVGITANGTAVVKNASYSPFAAAKGWEWGNSTTAAPNRHTRTFDADGRLTKVESGALDPLVMVYDAASRITQLQKLTGASVDPAKSQTYSYDQLDRLTAVTPDAGNPLAPQSYAYDATGNRLSRTQSGQATSYSYPATSHRLSQLSGAQATTFTYDAAGNRLSDGTQTWTYGGNGRPTGIAVGGLAPKTVGTLINAMGQRVAKTVNGVTTRYVYDEAGRLLGEYDAAGRMIQETLWFNTTPVGVLK
jgi:YD repeat-containing protein